MGVSIIFYDFFKSTVKGPLGYKILIQETQQRGVTA